MSESNESLPADRVRSAVDTLVRLRRVLERCDTGLTLPQYQLLSMVKSGGERSARLAEKLAVRKPTLTAAADSLVAAGLLEREADPGDRRVVRIRITDAGLAALAHAEDALAAAVEPILRETGDGEAALDCFERLGGALDRRFEAHRARMRAVVDGAAEALVAQAAGGGTQL